MPTKRKTTSRTAPRQKAAPSKKTSRKGARAGARSRSTKSAARTRIAGARKASKSASRKPAKSVIRPRQRGRAAHQSLTKRPLTPGHSLAPVRPLAVPTPVSIVEGVQPVTQEDLKEFEGRLLQERSRALKEMGHLESTVLKSNQRDSAGDLSGYTFHMADLGTDAMEREKAFLFASAEGRALYEIDEALRRLYQGKYGYCESCGAPISRARLEAVPQARLCLACKEKEERAARGAP